MIRSSTSSVLHNTKKLYRIGLWSFLFFVSRVYTADPLIPEVDVAPHFQREPNRSNKIKINKELYMIRDLEQYSGDLPLWSPLFFPTRNPE